MPKKIKALLEEFKAVHARATYLLTEDYVEKYLRAGLKYQDPKRITRHEHKVFSQHGEDGILREIFRRIATTSRFFVEFGCGKHGTENNTLALLIGGWRGCWLEWNRVHVKRIAATFRNHVSQGQLSVQAAFLTAENINEIFTGLNVPAEFDLLSIDADGNDYWFWKALKGFSPRVVVIEYNAVFPPYMRWVMKYDPRHRWDGSSHFGASLKSLELLADQKGYRLVGCDFSGSNAFFVREDLVAGRFLSPFTAEIHYEPPRYFLERQQGHPRRFGDFEAI